jgi:hypothetical protein
MYRGNVLGCLHCLAQHPTNLRQAGFEDTLTDYGLGPHRLQEFVLGDHLSGVSHKIGEDNQRLRRQWEQLLIPPQAGGAGVQAERPKRPALY